MLDALLAKLKVKDYSELRGEEKATYETWTKVLTQPDPTTADVRNFLQKENERAHAELEKYENSKERQIFYAALAHLTSTLSKFLAGPGQQREALKAHLREVFHI